MLETDGFLFVHCKRGSVSAHPNKAGGEEEEEKVGMLPRKLHFRNSPNAPSREKLIINIWRSSGWNG
jgi:hypothetical protein